ncbi:TfuA-like protein [Rhizobium herbae]|uniref:TfuA-like core domain-containing protein n=1 Tax=Rhizobium herbae TaxID=508661 RepID=A0ABS4ENI0_9HYPH|nr:TfuA-like protein [Rhizobium herbae]MBP1859371.1 hypothetical protein [Rhizobium herbae]
MSAARELFDADYAPPAKQADIYSAVRTSRPAVIVLIDGEFHQSLSVWHKEILYALAHGVRVIGASSMGALRAAELHTLGMIGAGRIFEDYRDGVINADDEVALTYGPAGLGYPQVTIPMVNLRATLDAAERKGDITSEQKLVLRERLHGIHFSERTRSRLHQEVESLGYETETFNRVFNGNFIDQKRLDAVEALQVASEMVRSIREAPVGFEFHKTHSMNVVDQQDRITNDGFRRREVAKFISLAHENFEPTLANALNRSLALLLGKMMAIEPSEDEIVDEECNFRERFSIIEEVKFEGWLSENDIGAKDFNRLMRENAVCRKLYDWQASIAGACEHTQPTLDYITLENRYIEFKKKMSSNRDFRTLTPRNSQTDIDDLSLNELLEIHTRFYPRLTFRPLAQWMKDVAFQGEDDLRGELIKLVSGDQAREKVIASVLALRSNEQVKRES